MCHSDALICFKASFSAWVLNQICPIREKSKIKFAYKSLITSWKLPGCVKAPRRIDGDKIQILEDYIVSQNYFKPFSNIF